MSKHVSILPGFSEIDGVYVDLAREFDVYRIGSLSKELIEAGLSRWIWNPRRVAVQIHDPETLVLVARKQRELIAFVIADFKTPIVNLVLLGVAPECQRLGVGSRLVKILEQSAIAMGHLTIKLEVRSKNKSAQHFYQKLGYQNKRVIPRYYSNCEDAVQMTHRLSYLPTLFTT